MPSERAADLAPCTILARNYLPKALSLADSLRRQGHPKLLTIFLIDADDHTQLPDLPGVEWMRPSDLAISEREYLHLAMFYDLVELATGVKPLVLQRLLETHENVAFFDPDTYATAPLTELVPALDASRGIVLTPHYLHPTPSGHHFGEGHLLNVGVYNLGFCAVNREAKDFLTWWWGHLASECLADATSGLFVDQKWVDIGAVLFDAASLQHPGYNVGIANLHERPVELIDGAYRIAGTDDLLRLFHFHAFDARRPDVLYGRSDERAEGVRFETPAILSLCAEYAERVLANEALVGDPPAYSFAHDRAGRRLTRRMRRVYRAEVLGGGSPPSPFRDDETEAYERWRRSRWRTATRATVSDVAKGLRIALPDEFAQVKKRFPKVIRTFRDRFVDDGGMWG